MCNKQFGLDSDVLQKEKSMPKLLVGFCKRREHVEKKRREEQEIYSTRGGVQASVIYFII
jgi:hypothetical protein